MVDQHMPAGTCTDVVYMQRSHIMEQCSLFIVSYHPECGKQKQTVNFES